MVARAAILSLVLVAAHQEAQDLIQWVDDYAEGRALARESGRPLMVVFR